jgi:hypothetical protein
MCWECNTVLENFSYQAYRKLLEMLASENVIVSFADLQAGKQPSRYFILRHDVDFWPETALRMAKLEAEMGVRATYFLLFSSPLYNLLSESNCLIPKQLVDLGHDVGLHYDVKVYATLGRQLGDVLHDEAEQLARMSGKSVGSIAMHNPSISGADPFRKVEDFVNAYDDEYTREISYYSDSGGAWGDEAVEALRYGHIPARLQLLVHPLFWDEMGVHRLDRLTKFIEDKTTRLKGEADLLRAMWAKHPRVAQHDKRRETQLELLSTLFHTSAR